jgi:hypothetical protein
MGEEEKKSSICHFKFIVCYLRIARGGGKPTFLTLRFIDLSGILTLKAFQ